MNKDYIFEPKKTKHTKKLPKEPLDFDLAYEKVILKRERMAVVTAYVWLGLAVLFVILGLALIAYVLLQHR